jgi:hypothetical protein
VGSKEGKNEIIIFELDYIDFPQLLYWVEQCRNVSKHCKQEMLSGVKPMNCTKTRILNHVGVFFLGLSFVCVTGSFAGESTQPGILDNFNVRSFGAVGDRQTDDTAAFQKALNAAEKAGGCDAGGYLAIGSGP